MYNEPLPDATLKNLEQTVLRGGEAAIAAIETLDAELAGADPDYAVRLREIIALHPEPELQVLGSRPDLTL
ncbi:hypothetical protein FXN63_17300 [Pigmentiphaga aceris]|uniref:Uncharacterized protein n=1 Tax=Pigmentiphaga aceris TaxID=1940612 RepID=A0A5C0AY38_9BURK|nr:hypothetical protein [Pigmentiphaga aceris]QEI07402.1 hypothetical protein FXN63_17300 [Pigmentiphaga aceris]